MEQETLRVFIVIIALWIIAVVGFVVYKINKKHIEIVETQSIKIGKILELNRKYYFYNISPLMSLTKTCKSKREFDRTKLKDFFVGCILEDHHYYKKTLNSVRQNFDSFLKYCFSYDLIMKCDSTLEKSLYEKYSFFKKKEIELCKKLKLKPTTSVTAHVHKRYTSPKGRNSYHAAVYFSQSEIENCYEKAKKIYDNKKTRKYQRNLMTDSLRYDVLKRDDFKCVLCGFSAQDGVKLHVDHIFPISKGGKTEMKNLRTLCSNCNHGKSAKYDPYGSN